MTVEEAIDYIALAVIAELIRDYTDDAWSEHSGIGEHDWELIRNRIDELAPKITGDEYDMAYGLLKARAGDVGAE